MNIKANELRIGNYLQDRENRLCKVESIDIAFIYSIVGEAFKAPAIYGGLTSLPHKPIPLTEDILLKCGAWTSDWDNNSSYRIGISLDYILAINLELNTFQLGDLDLTQIKYLHQLQNLYFALTGEELNINI